MAVTDATLSMKVLNKTYFFSVPYLFHSALLATCFEHSRYQETSDSLVVKQQAAGMQANNGIGANIIKVTIGTKHRCQ